jgi:hypothetical protein
MGRLLRLAPLTFAFVLGACTSMGHEYQANREQHEFGPRETLSVCLYVDNGINDEEARTLMENAWRDEAPLYGLDVKIAQIKRWPRPAARMEGIMAALRKEQLEAPCDRVLALIGRDFGDFMWSLLAPEYLGAVNTDTLTHGYAVARRVSLNQLISPPVDVTRHEIYHMLGCGEHNDMKKCYDQIALLKTWKREHESDFFPAWDFLSGRLLASREAVNERIHGTDVRLAARPEEKRVATSPKSDR